MIRKVIIICAYLSGVLGLNAQNVLTGTCNMPHVGDSIIRQQVEYFSHGIPGDRKVWDFRDLEVLEDAHSIKFCCDSDSTVLFGLESARIQKFKPVNDSLQWIGYETALHTMDYQTPITLYAYPIKIGDHFQQAYDGRGSYCNKYLLDVHGTIESEADACGIILFNDNDTIYNVLRLHQMNSSAIRQYLPNDTVRDSLNLKQRIEERYFWFARGYRYPVYETVTVTIFNNMVPVSCQQQAFCTLPSEQRHLKDTVNSQILETDSLERIQSLLPAIIHYKITVDGSNVNVHYSLDADANINIIICDKTGLVYRREHFTGTEGSTGTFVIHSQELRHGIYVLYMNVNGQVYNEKIEL